MRRAGEHPLGWVDRGVYLVCLLVFLLALFIDWGGYTILERAAR